MTTSVFDRVRFFIVSNFSKQAFSVTTQATITKIYRTLVRKIRWNDVRPTLGPRPDKIPGANAGSLFQFRNVRISHL